MKKACLYILMAVCFLLLLSALVVTPQDVPAKEVTREVPASAIVQFQLPVILVDSTQNEGQWLAKLWFVRLMMPCAVVCLLSLFLGLCKRDANGRVLVCKRYEDSVYQLFRQEVAGG